MTLFGSKWAGEILLETKRIHGLAHDASEQEVHEHLRGVQAFEEIAAAAVTAGAEELTAAQQQITALQEEKQTLESRVEELAAEVNTLQATVAGYKTQVEQLQADIKAANETIEQMKQEPAAEHTKGETDPSKPESGSGSMPVWEAFKKKHGL